MASLLIHPWRTAPAALLLALSLIACGGSSPTKDDPNNPSTVEITETDGSRATPRARHNNLSNDNLAQYEFDLNNDGKPDQFHFKNSNTIVRIHRDLNFDGRVDSYEYYSNGRMIEEEMDLDFDGSIDAVRFYGDGSNEVLKKSYATGFRQQISIVRWYNAAGQLIRIERDTDEDRRPDLWEYFQPGERTPYRVEIDKTGDGRPDTRLTDDGTEVKIGADDPRTPTPDDANDTPDNPSGDPTGDETSVDDDALDDDDANRDETDEATDDNDRGDDQ